MLFTTQLSKLPFDAEVAEKLLIGIYCIPTYLDPSMFTLTLMNSRVVLKVAFFHKVRFVFLNLQISKKIFQKTILNLKFKFPAYNTLLLLGEI